MPSVNLYQIPQVVQTTQAGAVGVNSPTNKVDFDLTKHVLNEIEFLVKDIDKKPINLRNKTLIIYIVDYVNNVVLLQRELQTIDENRGHCRLTIDPFDTLTWSSGYYSYSITVQRTDGSQILVHNDQGRSQRGFLQLFQGPLPEPQPAKEIANFLIETWGIPPVSHIVSGSFPGAAQRNNRSGKHTAAIYTNGFTGTVMVQASLETSAPTMLSQWFDIPDAFIAFDNNTGVHSIEFVGNFVWVRFVYVPAETNTGSLTKILFKN